MKNDKRSEFVSRESILKLLSDDEVARVSTAEAEVRLDNGDEYLDLEQLDQGVQWAPAARKPMGHLLPRKAVHELTWSKILTQLKTSGRRSGEAGT